MSILTQVPCELFTSDAVLLECGNASARKDYRDDVIELRRNLVSAGRAVSPTTDELDVAWQAYERRLNAGAGIVDQTSIVLMKRLGITEAFTNDEHFRAAGFVTLF